MTSRQLDADKKISWNPLRSSQGWGKGLELFKFRRMILKFLMTLNCRNVARVLELNRIVLRNKSLRAV